MRINYGPPRPSRTFDPVAAGWTPLSKLDSKRFMWLALLLGVPCFSGSLAVLFQSASDWKSGILSHAWGLTVLLIGMLLLVPVHELIHALAYRCGLRSPDLMLGVWPQRCLMYVLYDAPLPKERVLFMLGAPFLVLTVLPLGTFWLLPMEYRSMAVFLILVHTSVCGGDAITFARLCTQASPGSLVHNQGEVTYWGFGPVEPPPDFTAS